MTHRTTSFGATGWQGWKGTAGQGIVLALFGLFLFVLEASVLVREAQVFHGLTAKNCGAKISAAPGFSDVAPGCLEMTTAKMLQ